MTEDNRQTTGASSVDNLQSNEEEEDDNITYDQQMARHFRGRKPPPLLYRFIRNQGFELLEKIGKGHYSTVYRAKWSERPDQQLACKRISIEDVDEEWKAKCLNRELAIIYSLKYKYIVEVYKIIKTRRVVFIFMQLAPNGSIRELLHKNQKPLKQWKALELFCGFMSAISYIHTKGVAHRDLKLENILLDEHFSPLLSDFGLAVFGHEEHTLMQGTPCGTCEYMAPEVHRASPEVTYDAKKTDLYSAGVCLFEMVNFSLPFEVSGKTVDEILRLKMNREYRYNRSVENKITDAVKDMIHRLLDPNPITRLTITDINSHPALN